MLSHRKVHFDGSIIYFFRLSERFLSVKRAENKY